MVTYMVLRIPAVVYRPEVFTVGYGAYKNYDEIEKKLREDKNVISFYMKGLGI